MPSATSRRIVQQHAPGIFGGLQSEDGRLAHGGIHQGCTCDDKVGARFLLAPQGLRQNGRRKHSDGHDRCEWLARILGRLGVWLLCPGGGQHAAPLVQCGWSVDLTGRQLIEPQVSARLCGLKYDECTENGVAGVMDGFGETPTCAAGQAHCRAWASHVAYFTGRPHWIDQAARLPSLSWARTAPPPRWKHTAHRWRSRLSCRSLSV